jgi:predicted LPLAT superfamily acyltransferase
MSDLKQKTGWNGKSKANGLAYRIFLFVLENGGIRGAYIFLYFVTSYFFLFDRKSNRYTGLYFRKIWKFGYWKSRLYTYRTYYRFGQTILDKVAILAGDTDSFDVHFDGHDRLIDMGKAGEGGILISAHIGNWEIAGHFLKKVNRPVNVVMYDAEHEAIKNVLHKSLKNRAFKIILVKEDFSHLLEIRRALANKEFICIHGDRILDDRKSKFCQPNFLGRPVKIPRGPFELAVRFNVPYLFVFAIKETNRHYHFHAFPGKPESRGNVEAMIQDYVDSIEEVLTPYPDQWFNFYDYWDFDAKRAQAISKPAVEMAGVD